MVIMKYSVAELHVETETPPWLKNSQDSEQVSAPPVVSKSELAPEEEPLEDEAE